MQLRMKEKYQQEVIAAMMGKFGYVNRLQVPRVHKVVINMGVGEAVANPKVLEGAMLDLAAISGQKPVSTKAKKSVAAFKVRAGMPIGCRVTVRGDRMYDFLDRLFNLALPKLRDFRGISTRGFDGRGNFNLGLKEQLVFLEIDYDKVDSIRGMDISIVTTARSDGEARELLALMGMPFRAG